MYCESCGTPIADGHKFCTNCGAPAPVEPMAQQAQPAGGTQGFDPTQIPGYIPGFVPGQSGGSSNPGQAFSENPYTAFPSGQNYMGGQGQDQPYGQPQGQPYGQPQGAGQFSGYGQPYGGQPFAAGQQPIPGQTAPANPAKKSKTKVVIVVIIVLLLTFGLVSCGACAVLMAGLDSDSSSTPVTNYSQGDSEEGYAQLKGLWTIGIDGNVFAFELDDNGKVRFGEDGGELKDISSFATWSCYGIHDGKAVANIMVKDPDSGESAPFELQIRIPENAKSGHLDGTYQVTMSNISTFLKTLNLFGMDAFSMEANCQDGGTAKLSMKLGPLNESSDGTWEETNAVNGWGIAVESEVGVFTIKHQE